MNVSICPATGWWAVFKKNGKEIKVPVLFFEAYLTEGVSRKAIIYNPSTKGTIDALAVAQFERLVFESSADPSKKVTKAALLDFLRNSGAGFAEEDLRDRIKDGLVQRAADVYVDEQFEAFVEKEEL